MRQAAGGKSTMRGDIKKSRSRWAARNYLNRGAVEDREDGGVDEVTWVEPRGRMRGGWCNPAEEKRRQRMRREDAGSRKGQRRSVGGGGDGDGSGVKERVEKRKREGGRG